MSSSILYLCLIPTFSLLLMMQFIHCFLVPALFASSAPAPVALPSPASGPLWVAAPAGITITGRVVNRQGAPLAGVFITMQSAAATATTNSAGSFLLASEVANPVLTFKCAGFQTQTVLLKSAQPVVLTMNEIGTAPVALAAGLEAVNKLLNMSDEQPAFPGGVAAYRTFLQQNVRYPEAAKAKKVSGDVFVSFVVDEAGRLLDAEVVKGIGYGLDEEALRLVRLMPWWTPGLAAGKPVRVPATLRIRFGLQEE
jgi:TonB family protein